MQAFDLINSNLEDARPSKSVFATQNEDCFIFNAGEQEIAVSCEWFSNNGEKWSFVSTILSRADSLDIGYKPSHGDIEDILNQLSVAGATSSEINAIVECICKEYADFPVISAHEGYFGS